MLIYGQTHCILDLSTTGKRAGFIDTKHSDNVMAFSSIRTPIGVIAGGSGPTIMLSAGNHGDEYEGQIILHRLFDLITPEQITGRLILLPALNTPAVGARSRVSPIDNANMNRSFPGAMDQGPSKTLTGFVTQHLIPTSDMILDFHSGGTATQYVDCAFLCVGKNEILNKKNIRLSECFGAPFTMVCPIDGTGGDFDTAAHNQGKAFLSCELGGMGTLNQTSIDRGWQGCLRILKHAQIITQAVFEALGGISKSTETQFIDIAAGSNFITASRHGLADMQLEVGQFVAKEDITAILRDTHIFGQEAETLYSPQSGYVAVRRRNPIVVPGDHLYLICNAVDKSEISNLHNGPVTD